MGLSAVDVRVIQLTRRMEAETGAIRFRMVARRLANALREEKYRADQPRAPAGRPEGGQWIWAGGSSRRGGSQGRTLVATMGRVTFSGPLVWREYDAANDRTRCLYKDLTSGHIFGLWYSGRYCPSGQVNY